MIDMRSTRSIADGRSLVRRRSLAAGLVAFVACTSRATAGDSIQDNSFLIEEAYNQESGVVQHISTFDHREGGAWLTTFTQEWPAPGLKHQISYTLALQDPGFDVGAGVGDAALNYRYQLAGTGETRVAFAPRISLLLPTGDDTRGRGTGSFGVQWNLPLSIRLRGPITAHANAGLTHLPEARDTAGHKASSTAFNLGGSLVAELHPKANLMLEVVWSRAQVVVAQDETEWSNAVILSPGLRFAIDVPNGLQIVPGIAVPIGVGPSRGETGLFVYLSFEHPFRAR